VGFVSFNGDGSYWIEHRVSEFVRDFLDVESVK